MEFNQLLNFKLCLSLFGFIIGNILSLKERLSFSGITNDWCFFLRALSVMIKWVHTPALSEKSLLTWTPVSWAFIFTSSVPPWFWSEIIKLCIEMSNRNLALVLGTSCSDLCSLELRLTSLVVAESILDSTADGLNASKFIWSTHSIISEDWLLIVCVNGS